MSYILRRDAFVPIIIIVYLLFISLSLSYITSAKKASIIGKDGKSSSVGARDLSTTLSNSAWSTLSHSGFSDRKRNVVAKVSVVVFDPARKRSRHSINKFSPAARNIRACVNGNLFLLASLHRRITWNLFKLGEEKYLTWLHASLINYRQIAKVSQVTLNKRRILGANKI